MWLRNQGNDKKREELPEKVDAEIQGMNAIACLATSLGMGVHITQSKGCTKRGGTYLQVKRPNQSMERCIPTSRGHTKAWKCPPREAATVKSGIWFPQLNGHTQAWESVSPTQGATTKRGSAYANFKGPRQRVGVWILNPRRHNEVLECGSVN